ncbi:beta-mannanase [Granulicella aggregans]|uniref:Beta-mannanase n=1 Tax=Granulicella aggregans TaxID=474949 RepID=A0A7W7ZEN3_9BACT|nr:glycosyl hydrolase [Granulicella aggregans]MBB5057956.1 beta-mannanase [Granulicella aggregans]
MKAFFSEIVLSTSVLLSIHSNAQSIRPNAAPVNPDATPAARALLQEIDSVSGHATLSGQHNFPNTVSRYSDRIYELTGHYPAVFGQDFGFSGGEDKDSTLGRPAMIQEVIRQYRSGSVIALTWHSVRPTEDEPVTFRDSVQGHLTDWEFRQVLTPGSDMYKRWARQVDVIAGYLQELQAAGVPVLFRPYHEMNGNWFWWGGRPGPDGTSALYRQIFDRFVHQKHLNNLIWVWNVNAPSVNAGPVDQYFPGSAYADIVSMDIYGPFEKAYYDSMIALAGDTKPIALAEVGAMPSLEILAAQPRWSYTMMWSGMAEGSNTPAQLQAVFHAPNVVDRGDPRLSAPLPSAATPQPSDPEATPAAKQLLEKLSMARSTGVEIAEFTADVASAPALADEIRVATKAGRLPILRWTPPSPTGEGMAVPLSDFEWNELVSSGTALHEKWLAEIDAVLPLLQQLDKEHVAVAWSPLPEANAHNFWWGARPGPEGSRALLREIGDRLTSHGLHNLVWIWEAAVSPAAPTGPNRVPIQDLYPGPLGVDAILLDVDGDSATHGFAARGVEALAGIKPVGLRSSAPLAKAALTDSFSWTYTPLPNATQ